MKLLMLLISAVFAMVFLGVPVHAAQAVQFEDGPRVKNPFMLKVKGLYRAKKYAELDAMADSFSSPKHSFFPDGGSKLRTFSSTFELEGDYPELVYTSCIGLGEGWRRARPTSVPARIALAQHWLDYAWKARGHGYAKEVKENAWPEFRNRLDTAWKIINEPLAPGVADSPERHCLRLKLATYRAVERGEFDVLFREAVRLYPNYINLYIRKAEYLTPRWHGRDGEWQQFLAEVAKKNPQGMGATVYSRTVWAMSSQWESFSDASLSWETTKLGFKQIMRNFPNSPFILNTFANFACVAGDRKTLSELFKSIDSGRYYPEAWISKDAADCRSMAGLSPR